MSGRREQLGAHEKWAGLWLSLVVASLAGCSDEGTHSPEGLPITPAGLAVSDPVPVLGAKAALAAVGQQMVYVAAEPGTFPEAISVTVANSVSGASLTIEVVDGGFDPFAIAGSPGDVLEIIVRYADGRSVRYLSTVPNRKRPRVVRTRPSKDAVDVRLNSTAVVVFSEPVDPRTVTLQNITLLLDASPVAATLTLDEAGLQAELTPEQPFVLGARYTLRITTEIADLSGDALEQAVNVSFTTQTALSDQIVFTAHSQEDWENGIYDNEIYVMNADGSGLAKLTDHLASDQSPAVSPDGTRILFTTDRDGDGEIYVMNADGSGLVNLTNHPAEDGDPVWSPDGTAIAFRSYRDDTGENACYFWSAPTACSDIFVMNADGSNPVNLTNNLTALDGHPAWSLDGTKIAFQSDRDAGGTPDCPDCWEIFVMSADGSNVVKLTDYDGPTGGGFWPTWAPDGTKIAFTSGSGGLAIWVMNADGSNPVKLTGGPPYVVPASRPSWSPDGSRIAFSMVAPPCELCAPLQNDVFVMNADGSNPVNLTNRPGFENYIGSAQAWSPQR